MSTILDALRKVQRERSAQAPPADLRGSVTSETPSPARRRPRRSSGWIAALALILAVGAAGSWLYSSGRIDAWLGGPPQEERVPTEAELDALERETREQEAALAHAESGTKEEVTPPQPTPQAPPAETPEIAAERARLEAAIANARAAQEAQREAERAQAEQMPAAQAQAAASKPEPPAPQLQTPPPAPAPPAPRKAVVAKPARTAPAARPSPQPAEASAPIQSAFPDVAVVSIRWHPIPERRVASLRFERLNVPEAHEGDIVSGVRVHRIDPGAVELRVGSAKRTVSPGP